MQATIEAAMRIIFDVPTTSISCSGLWDDVRDAHCVKQWLVGVSSATHFTIADGDGHGRRYRGLKRTCGGSDGRAVMNLD